MAVNRQGSARTEEQLLEMLDDAAEWIVRGKAGRLIGTANCLREALTGASRLGHDVTALVRMSGEPIIIFVGQIERIANIIDARPSG